MQHEHTHDHTNHTQVSEHSPIEIIKFVFVLIVILAISLLLSNKFGDIDYSNWSRWFMGVFFVVFAGFKFVGYKMFTMMFAGYDILAKRSNLYAHLYPFIELGLGLSYIFNLVPTIRDTATLIIMSVSAVGVFNEIKKRSGVHCACLGNIIKLPLSTVSLVEDLGMGFMALIAIITT